MKICVILAALVISQASKVAVRDAFMGKGQATSPWLGLLTSSWSLAGMSQDKKSDGLDSLATGLLNLAKTANQQNPDPSMLAAVQAITGVVESMKADINGSVAAMQAELDEKLAAVTECNTKTPVGGNPSDGWTSGLAVTLEQVKTCRDMEAEYYWAWKNCTSLVTKCTSSTDCCSPVLGSTYHQHCPTTVISESPMPLGVQCDGKTRCDLDALQAIKAYFQQKLDNITAEETKCDSSRAGCPATLPDCTLKKTIFDLKQKECNGLQKSFEQQYCDLAEDLEGKWDTYETCHTTAENALKQEEIKQTGILPGLQQQYRGVLRIECLVQALGSADVSTGLTDCIAKTYTAVDWPHLVLKTYTPLTGANALAVCSDKLLAPGTDYFRDYFYYQFPAIGGGTLPLMTTTHCVSALATSHCPVAQGPIPGRPTGSTEMSNMFGSPPAALMAMRAARGRAEHRHSKQQQAAGRLPFGFRF